MTRLRIAAAYVFGTGSSQVLKFRIEDALKQHGIAADVFVTDLNLRPEDSFDVIFTSKELAGIFLDRGKPIVVINNFLSQQEIEAKGIPVILSLNSKTKK
jgi:galactitol-specific phosphotransferase system IIB component